MPKTEGVKHTFEPRIVAFFCNWCTYTAATPGIVTTRRAITKPGDDSS
jgi:hypothetical protein